MAFRVAWVLLAAVLLAGCGTRPTGHGAPPYQEPPAPRAVPLRTSYPGEGLRFTLPPMAGEDREAVRAYLLFSREAFATWRSGRPTPGLRRFATPAMRRLVIKLTPTEHAYGVLGEPTLIEIRDVSTQGVLSALSTCVRHAGKASATGALVVQTKDGTWRVSASGPLHHRLRHCA